MGEVKTIGLYLANCVEYPAIIAGALHAGLVITPLNPAYTPSEARIYNAVKATKICLKVKYLPKNGRNIHPDTLHRLRKRGSSASRRILLGNSRPNLKIKDN